MTEQQIMEHQKQVLDHALEIAMLDYKEQWKNYLAMIDEMGECRPPKELEENIQAVFNYAYIQGIAIGIEDTIVRYNKMFNHAGKGGVA